MRFFLQVTGIVALGIVLLVVLGWVLHIVLIAAIIAALVVGFLALRNVFTRRGRRVGSITYRR